jgi:hypothetical protein
MQSNNKTRRYLLLAAILASLAIAFGSMRLAIAFGMPPSLEPFVAVPVILGTLFILGSLAEGRLPWRRSARADRSPRPHDD